MSDDACDVILRLREIVVRRGELATLRVPNFEIRSGEIVTLAGPNGAGKSTFLQVAALILKPESGEIWIGGELARDKRAVALRRRIAMVFQSPLLFDVRVLENVTSGLRFRRVNRREAETRGKSWLAKFGVERLAERPSRALSGGEAQRVALARAMAVDPILLLLDEPFGALDAPTRSAIVPDLIRNLRETGTAAIIVTHDFEEALELGDRLGIVLEGRIAQLDVPSKVVADPANEDVAAFIRGSLRPPRPSSF